MIDEEDLKKTLDAMGAKIDELSRCIGEKKDFTESRIRENPIAYVSGAFVGGLFVGYLLGRKN